MSNNTSHSDPLGLGQIAATYDKATVWFTLCAGVPGNILTFLTMMSLPSSVSTFHFCLLSSMDLISLCLQLFLRVLDWYDVVAITSKGVNIWWRTFFNFTYYTSIYANWVLVYIAVERLIATRYPSQIAIYLNPPRAKANAVLTVILIYCFSAIVTVKMNYFGIAWVVIFTTFYTGFPLLLIFIIIMLLLNTFRENRKMKEKLLKLHPHGEHHHKNDPHTMSKSLSGLSRHSAPCGHAKYDPVNYLTDGHKTSPSMSKSTGELSKHVGLGHGKPDLMTTSMHSAQSAHYSPSFCYTSSAKKITGSAMLPEAEEEPAEMVAQKAKDKAERESSYTIMMLTTSLLFLILTVPYTVIQFIYVSSEKEIIDEYDESQVKMYLLIMIAMGLMYFHHSIKFYIFFVCSSYFRRQLIKALTRKSLPTVVVKEYAEADDPKKSFL